MASNHGRGHFKIVPKSQLIHDRNGVESIRWTYSERQEQRMEQLQPGQMLGAYRILNKIGQGGMATVYKAYQPSMDRNVAIKVLPSQLAESKEFVTRFRQEARTIARLEHPHILPVFDFGEDDGVTYFVMRFLEAGTLKNKMEAGPLDLDEIDRIFTQLAEALGYAHSHGVVHRDLKPANALVDSSGNLFLTDFGIAKLLESASPRLTQTDAIMGTPAYISPEQAQAAPVDQRSDIYSLGIILYEMVTGRVPFVADTPLAVILKHLNEPLPLPSALKGDIPPAIEQVILKALAKNPNDRFANTAEFIAAWRRALREMATVRVEADKTHLSPPSQPIATPRPSQPQPASVTGTYSQPKARKPATGLLVGCAAVACLALGGVGTFMLMRGLLDSPTPIVNTPAPTVQVIPPTDVPDIPVETTVLFQDDFSASNWGTGTDSDSSVEYASGRLNFQIFRSNYIVWSTPDYKVYQDIRIDVTAFNNNTDSATAFGVLCNQQSSSNSETYYFFVMTPAGDYAIVKAVTGQTDVLLTNNGQWVVSEKIAKNDSYYRLTADCGIDGTLTFFVDGQEIDSVVDTAFTSGGVGLIIWSGEGTVNNVSFDDFVVSDLP
jgi:serine/threonine protein kinase